ncbi:MAG: hypothetical protein C0432_01265 [Candidatus Puniceispirillum sp.]|nr:hypothetical protein [Candidatus Pelagibacter sp.]MBA4282911.1 hypothetical protein [Candidatus Puniceispirillum sp.]
MKNIRSFFFGKSFIDEVAENICASDHSLLGNGGDENETIIFLPTNRSVLNLKKKIELQSLQFGQNFHLPRFISLSDIESMECFLVKYDESFIPQKTMTGLEKFLYFFSHIKNIDSVKQKVEWIQYFIQLEESCCIADISIEKVKSYVISDYFLCDDASKEYQSFKEIFLNFCLCWEQLKEKNILTQTAYRSLLCGRIADVIDKKNIGRMIIAGTTGTIPATRYLIQSIVKSEDGIVFLPGFDPVDFEQAKNQFTHPQHTISQLIQSLHIDSVTQNPEQLFLSPLNERGKLIYQCYREETIDLDLTEASKNLFLHAFDNLQEEAISIVHMVEYLLEKTTSEIAIVTSNVQLMSLLQCNFDFKNIKANFSSSLVLQHSPVGQYLLAVLNILESPQDTQFWLYLMKHPLFLNDNRVDVLNIVRFCELELRTKVEFGKTNLFDVLKDLKQNSHTIDCLNSSILELVIKIIESIKYLIDVSLKEKNFLNFLIDLENILEISTDHKIVHHHDGASLAGFLNILKQDIKGIRNVEFIPHIKELMVIAPNIEDPSVYGSRVRVLGTLESRSNIAEVVICASQNEGIWPRDPDIDPFISLSTKLLLGFPHPKRQQGLAAHDWCSNLYGEIVVLTRSKSELGQSQTHNRYWQRLLDLGVEESSFFDVWDFPAVSFDKDLQPISLPEPKPLLSLRPLRYSASQIDRLMNDPYSFFVSHILKLKSLKNIDERLMFVEKGLVFHKIFEEYLNVRDFSKLTYERLLEIANIEFSKVCFQDVPLSKIIWQERFHCIAQSFYKKLVQEPVDYRKVECLGQMLMNVNNLDVYIHARMDRLEMMSDLKKMRVIDYKTGSLPTQTDIYSGKSFQILLQALLLNDKRFGLNQGLNIETIAELWQLQGTTEEPIKVLSLHLNAEQKKDIQKAIHNLLSFFLNSNTPYLSRPSYDDDIYFSRKEEWQHHN